MPQKRGVPPDEAAERIVNAVDALAAAKLERDAAITAGLLAGGSIREVAAVSGMSERQVQTIGHANGWPSAEQKRRWEQAKLDRERWMALVDHYRALRVPADPPG